MPALPGPHCLRRGGGSPRCRITRGVPTPRLLGVYEAIARCRRSRDPIASEEGGEVRGAGSHEGCPPRNLWAHGYVCEWSHRSGVRAYYVGCCCVEVATNRGTLPICTQTYQCRRRTLRPGHNVAHRRANFGNVTHEALQ